MPDGETLRNRRVETESFETWADGFLDRAKAKLRECGWDSCFLNFTYGFLYPRWELKGHIYGHKNFDFDAVTGTTQAELIAVAEAWLANLRSQEEVLADILGVAA